MPEDEDRGLLNEVDVEDTAVVEVTVVDSVSLDVEEEEVVVEEEEEEEEEDVVDVEEADEEEVVPSVEAPFSTVKVGLTASSPEESMISIS